MRGVHDQIPDRPLNGNPHARYSNGYIGCYGDHEDCPTWARRVAKYDRQRLEEVVGEDRYKVEQVWPNELNGTGEGKASLNHLYAMAHIPRAYEGSQDYGNCRAWSMRMATCTVIGMEAEAGELVRTDVRHGTALVYGSRQSSSQGMTMSRGCEVVTTIGQSEEKDYGFIDLSDENTEEKYGNEWGRSGPPRQLVEACTGDVMERAYHIDNPTPQLVKDLFYNESVIDTGSTVTGRGPGNPLVGLKSIGGHAQVATGYDDRDECKSRLGINEAVVFMQQSWGNWIEIKDWPEDLWGPYPQGCWPITMSNFLKLVRGWNDSWAVVGAKGFQPRRLPDWGTHLYL